MKDSCAISIGRLRRLQAHVLGSRTARTVDANVALGRFPRSGSWRCHIPDTVHITMMKSPETRLQYMTNNSEPRHWPQDPEVESDGPAIEDEFALNALLDDLPLEADPVDVLEQRAAVEDDSEDIAAGDWAE